MMMIPTSLSLYEQHHVICGGIVGGIPHAVEKANWCSHGEDYNRADKML